MTMIVFGADQYSISFIGHVVVQQTIGKRDGSKQRRASGKQWTKGIRGGSCAQAEGTSFEAELETRSEGAGKNAVRS